MEAIPPRYENHTFGRREEARNEDPITGAPGSHASATAAGAVMGGILGAAAGTALGGPVGGAVGAGLIAGAFGGGLLGKAAGEGIDPTVEDTYWRERHPLESYTGGESYESYEPAYRAGYEGYERYGGTEFADVEADIRKDYESRKATLPWEKARPASESAWKHVWDRKVTESNR